MNQANQQHTLIMGIDPDVDKSGIAIIDAQAEGGQPKTHVETLDLPHLMDYAIRTRGKCERNGWRLRTYVEASWKLQSNWHLNWKDSKQVAAAKGHAAGRNHQVGMDICTILRAFGITVIEAMPLPKGWHGHDRKITQLEINALLPCYDLTPIRRTNQEGRDAVLLALYNSGLSPKKPIPAALFKAAHTDKTNSEILRSILKNSSK